MKKLILLYIALLVLFPCEVLSANYTGKAIRAKLASEEIDGDFMTVWAGKFSEHMKQWSGGKIRIDVYPYGTLGNTGDINELAQMGIVQFVFFRHAWIMHLFLKRSLWRWNYIFPPEKVPEILEWMVKKAVVYAAFGKSLSSKRTGSPLRSC
jgi:TRAP-type C4-dicarboxylate transport system substrate-binding protein